jgi:RNA polymerase sigma-70 factor (ECF subfamily)
LERLVERHRPALRRWAAGRLPRWARDRVDTDDLVQDTLMQTVKKIEAFEPRHNGALQAYLRQALQNRLRDEIRHQRRSPKRAELDDATVVDEPSPLEMAVGQENLERYEAALTRLSDGDRELIVLRIEMGASYEELATAMGKPSPNAARVAVMRALLRLGEELADER